MQEGLIIQNTVEIQSFYNNHRISPNFLLISFQGQRRYLEEYLSSSVNRFFEYTACLFNIC